MRAFLTRPRTLLGAGLILMVLGAVDPLEGSVVIVGGTALAALGAFLGHESRRGRLVVALALIVVGVATTFALSAVGGIGGSTGRSWWWVLAILPYPVGWVLGLIATLQMLRHRTGPLVGSR
jgi:hypothetical protein